MGCCSIKNVEIARLTARVADLDGELAGVDHAVALAFPPVDLDDFSGEGVIVQLRTGVRWTRRAGGTSCSHPQAQGVFLPLPVVAVLEFAHDLSPDWAFQFQETALMDRVDRALDAAGYPLKVNRVAVALAVAPAFQQYGEAWLPVRVVDRDGCFAAGHPQAALKPFVGMAAVLTWPNSD